MALSEVSNPITLGVKKVDDIAIIQQDQQVESIGLRNKCYQTL